MKKIILQSFKTTLLSYVLSDEREGKITAIIEGKNGEDVTDKVIQAISEDLNAQDVKIKKLDEKNNNEYQMMFSVDVVDEDGSKDTIDFNLTLTAKY
jgi:hypothetical protein